MGTSSCNQSPKLAAVLFKNILAAPSQSETPHSPWALAADQHNVGDEVHSTGYNDIHVTKLYIWTP